MGFKRTRLSLKGAAPQKRGSAFPAELYLPLEGSSNMEKTSL